MIKFENTEVFNFEGAIRGMRNPLNSWDKSDSTICPGRDSDDCKATVNKCPRGEDPEFREDIFCIGKSDLDLMKRLIKAGSDHRKFMRQILVSVDITAPLYWWKEFDTYKVGTVSNSCSTMHKIHAKKFTIDDFSHEHLTQDAKDFLLEIIGVLNDVRSIYINFDKYIKIGALEKTIISKKDVWWQMIQLLPSSYNQRRTITLNYETLYNIYGSRKNHKLDEWSVGFMEWIESLPYAEELITDRN